MSGSPDTDPAVAMLDHLLYFSGSLEHFSQLLLATQSLAVEATGAAIFTIRRPSVSDEGLDEAAFTPAKETEDAEKNGGDGQDKSKNLRETPKAPGAPATSDLGVPSIRCLHPPPATPEAAPPAWLQAVVAAALERGAPASTKLMAPPGGGQGTVALQPLSRDGSAEDYAVFRLPAATPERTGSALQRLLFTPVLWKHYRAHERRLADGITAAGVLSPAMAVLAETNRHGRFLEAAFAFVNEIAARFQADRATLGFVRGRYVKVAALSHAEKFGKNMDLVQAIEGALEECVDQDAEVFYPAPPAGALAARAAGELARRHASATVASLPLRYDNEVVAAVAVEWPEGQAPTTRELKLLRLVCDLAAPRLVELQRHDRWPGARAAAALRRGLAWGLGPRHTWAKAAAVAALAALGLAVFLRGPHRLEGSFVLRHPERRVVAAPFDGFIAEAPARPGDELIAGETKLARLETGELRARRASRAAERHGFEKEAALARRDHKLAEAQIAEARIEQADADLALFDERLAAADVRAPVGGVVLTGEWTGKIGAPVKLGDTLYEIAPRGALEAELHIPAEDIGELRVGARGELAAAGAPTERVGFEVVRLVPAAEMVKQKNVFRVLARLDHVPAWFRPGMEGVAKVDIGQRRYAWLWTRRAVNWVRMMLWV